MAFLLYTFDCTEKDLEITGWRTPLQEKIIEYEQNNHSIKLLLYSFNTVEFIAPRSDDIPAKCKLNIPISTAGPI